jgi:signal transduction histidine kinase
MRFGLGIRAQLTAGIVLTTLAGIGLIGLMSIKIVESRSVYRKVAEAENLVGFIRTAVFKLKGPGESARTIDFIGTALKGMGVKDFQMTDGSGRVLLKDGVLPKDYGKVVSYSGGVKVNRIGGGWLSGPGEMLYVRASLVDSGRGGRVSFTLSLTGINEYMSGVRRFLLLYAVLDSVIIIAFGVYYLSRSITTPIRKLEDAATRIAGGALGERVDLYVDNEIGSLAASFNTMAERIEAEIKTMERVNRELVSTQEELLRSSTLAAVGRLAAGIAHEIGNPLGAVRGYLDILGAGGDAKEEQGEIIERAAKEVSRIDSILREFLDIARPSKSAPGPVDVNMALRDTIATLDAHSEVANVRITTALADDLPPVMIDEGKLRQVFLNLLINALQSLDETRAMNMVTVETCVLREPLDMRDMLMRRSTDWPVSGTDNPEEKEYVVIRVTDTGRGVSDEDAKKIFDPFFTTKEVGKGTGLGLFVSESIIKTYGGEIGFKSSIAEGSTFTVKLPLARLPS